MSYFPFSSPLSTQINNQVNNDTFGRIRVSEPFATFDSKQMYDNQPLLWSTIASGTGASGTYISGTASTNMSVNTSGTYVIRQAFSANNYQTGKSELALFTGVMSPISGINQALGLYDSSITAPYTINNGMGWYSSGNTIGVAEVNNGTLIYTPSSSFSIDKLDGTGPSAYSGNWTMTQIYGLAYEWLGVGEISYFVVASGTIIPCHMSKHTNNLSNVYTAYPNLPAHYEIRQNVANVSGTMKQICTAVISEGGVNPVGRLRSQDIYNVTGAGINSEWAALVISLQSGTTMASILLEDMSFLTTTSANGRVRVILNPTIASTLTFNTISNSALQFASGTASNTVTGGTILDTQYFSSQSKGTATTQASYNNSTLRLGKSINGTLDQIALCVTSDTASIVAYGALAWQEL